ncbi:MAG TPA: SPFH domain-containing protein [Candidatus Saccharimonadales bacterium]|nr:SPFH domain-containing protein [Candidatus Saccharimonadales bacterium]
MTLGFGQLFTMVDGIPSPWDMILKVVIVIGAILGLLISTVRFVPEGFVGMRTRFGKVIISRKTGQPIILNPSPRFIVPKFYSLILVSSRDRTFRCGPTQVQYGNYMAVSVSATVTFALHYAYNLQYRVDDLDERVSAACTSTLCDILSDVADGDIRAQMQQIRDLFSHQIAWLMDELGLRFKALDITNIEHNALFAVAESIRSLGANGQTIMENLNPKSKQP